MTEQHNDERWLGATASENYERFFVPAIGRPVAEDLLRVAELKTGERVLDVGCGTGVVTRLAAEQVGRRGQVAGLDVNPDMISVAQASTPPELAIKWHQASAESMPLPDEAFDVVLCQMSLQFVADRLQALREMRRVQASNGRVLLNVPGPMGPPFAVLAKALGQHIAPKAAGFVQAVFALHDESELERLLKEAGFHGVETRERIGRLSLPPPRDFLWQYVSSTPLAAVVADAGDDAREGLEHDVVNGWKEFETDDGMTCEQRVVIASGRR
ncbi:MAG: class I SAM-dependent methyltransferase [Opitutaceae bacterium]